MHIHVHVYKVCKHMCAPVSSLGIHRHGENYKEVHGNDRT